MDTLASIRETIEACGAVAGSLAYIPGRSFFVKTDSTGSFQFDLVPAGLCAASGAGCPLLLERVRPSVRSTRRRR